MIKPVHVLAFSGHRNLPENSRLAGVISEALLEYRKESAAAKAELHLHCMIAWGADLIALEQAEALGIPFHIVLPKELIIPREGQPLEGLASDYVDPATGRFMAAEWERTLRIIEKAAAGLNGGSLRTYAEHTTQRDCFYDCVVKMLSIADGLLVVWNGREANGPGGTADSHAHATSIGIPIWVVPPDSADAASTRPPGSLLGSEGMEIASLLLPRCDGDFAQALARLDADAETAGGSFRGKMSKTIFLHFNAALIAALTASFITYEPARFALVALSVVQGSLVTLAWLYQRRIIRSNAHTRWLNLRFGAELVRSAEATQHLADPLHPFVHSHRPEWSRFVRSVSLRSKRAAGASASWEEQRGAYVRGRLESQITYFENKKKEADRESAALQRFLSVATMLAPWVSVMALLYKAAEKFGLDPAGLAFSLGLAGLPYAEFLRFLPIALPLAAGYLGSRRQASDAERRRIRYAELARQLRLLSRAITLLRSRTSAARIVRQAEEALLAEQLEWRLREEQSLKR